MKTVTPSIPPQPRVHDFHAAIAQVSHAASSGEPFECAVILYALRFATPDILCGLTALLAHAAQFAERVTVHPPDDDRVYRYLTRMDLQHATPANVRFSRPASCVHGRGVRG